MLMCTAIFSASLCSCGHDNTSYESSEISQVEEDNFKEDSSYYTGTFNEEVFEHIIQNINLKGIKVSMPCSLNDMGKGFEVSFPLFFEKKSLSTYSLNYNDTSLGQIVYYSDHELTDKELENDEFIQLCINTPNLSSDNVSVAGIEIYSNYKILENVLGQPTSKNYDGKSGFYKYELSEKKYINFHIIDDLIDTVYVNVK